MISVSIDQPRLRALEAELAGIKNGAARAAVSAINRTVATGRTRIVRKVSAEINLKQKDIREVITIRNATRANLAGAIRVGRKPIPLYRFAPNPNMPGHSFAKGVSVKVRKSEGRELLKHTFIARMKSGHIGVYERKGRGSSRAKRLPIVERFGPSPLGILEGMPGMIEGVMSELGVILEKNLASQVNRLLSRRKL